MSDHARYTIDCDRIARFTAAYLRVAGDECAFIEAHTAHALPKLLAELQTHGLHPEQVRWVVVTHAHLDHAAGASALLQKCPNALLLAHPRAARHLIDPAKLIASATSVYGAARFAEFYGTIEPIPQNRVRALEDGETFDLGTSTLRVHHTAGHAKHHFVVDDPAVQTVYTGDAFGLVYPALQRGVRFAIASTSPTDFDAAEAHRSIEMIVALGEQSACLTHFDEVRDLDEVARQLHAWIDRSEGWLQAAQKSGDDQLVMKGWIKEQLRVAIAEETQQRGLVLDANDWQLLDMDMELNAAGLAFVAEKQRASGAAGATVNKTE